VSFGLSGGRYLVTDVRPDDPHALEFSPIDKMSDVLIIRSIMPRRGRNGTAAIDSSYDWVPRRTKRKEAARGFCRVFRR
jgi:hypothetical protein